jgi:hypothetical protein
VFLIHRWVHRGQICFVLWLPIHHENVSQLGTNSRFIFISCFFATNQEHSSAEVFYLWRERDSDTTIYLSRKIEIDRRCIESDLSNICLICIIDEFLDGKIDGHTVPSLFRNLR